MKAVIMAAGRGTRMSPLTNTIPKLLVPVFNKPLLLNFIEILTDYVDEIIFVINFERSGDQIRNFILDHNFPVKIDFAFQDEQKGTAHALQSARKFFKKEEKFLCMNGDDIYFKEDIGRLLEYDCAALAKKVLDYEKWGIFNCDNDSNLEKIIEKPQEYIGNLANVGLYLINAEIFDLYARIKLSSSGEFYLTDSVSEFAKKFKVKVIEGRWLPLGNPSHILAAHKNLVDTQQFVNEGEIEDDVIIKGRVKLGKNSIIKSGAEINGDIVVGENCEIGTDVTVSGVVVIGNNCKIAGRSIIENSTVFDNSSISNSCEISNSIIGQNVSVDEESIISNKVFTDEQTVELV